MAKSQEITELAKALSAFQGELKGAKRDEANPFFKSKYASLSSVWETVRAGLQQNGLSLTQIVDFYDSEREVGPILTTMLMHTSGEWISGDMILTPAKDNDPQAMGSALTYARRYAMGAILGVVTDEDDDGERAMQRDIPPTRQPRLAAPQTRQRGGNPWLDKADEVERRQNPVNDPGPSPTTTPTPKRRETRPNEASAGVLVVGDLREEALALRLREKIKTQIGTASKAVVTRALEGMSLTEWCDQPVWENYEDAVDSLVETIKLLKGEPTTP